MTNQPHTIWITNIGELATPVAAPAVGDALGRLDRHANCSLIIEGDRILEIAPSTRVPPQHALVIDAGGGCVVPGLVDCHTHTVFAGSRADEFVKRIKGQSYLEIAQAGGGILSTVQAVRAASEDELVELALPRLARMLAGGTTTAEVKSGYGLSVADELKMLRAIRRLNALQPIDLVGTYLAAHTVPPEFAGRPDAYLDAVLDDAVLREIQSDGLAEFVDVFCERGAFDLAQSRRVLDAGRRFGLRGRVHADQITQMGASQMAAELGAASADHLETITDQAMDAMRRAGTIAVLLPACSFFLGVEQAPARRIIDAGVPVALATDFNPGSSHIESMPLTLAIACTQLRMTPAEALTAATANAAAVLGRHDNTGRPDGADSHGTDSRRGIDSHDGIDRNNGMGIIAPGRPADVIILSVPTVEDWCYCMGRNCINTVIKSGVPIHMRPA